MTNLHDFLLWFGFALLFAIPITCIILASIRDDISNQCISIASNTTIKSEKCYKDNVPFPLNIDTSDWHIWKVNKP